MNILKIFTYSCSGIPYVLIHFFNKLDVNFQLNVNFFIYPHENGVSLVNIGSHIFCSVIFFIYLAELCDSLGPKGYIWDVSNEICYHLNTIELNAVDAKRKCMSEHPNSIDRLGPTILQFQLSV